ncbi:MAG TPA: CHASE2 domain-containing protein [Chroococcidiopsis sp.]
MTMLDTVIGGRYKIITELGAGGFGQTYLAEDLQDPEDSPCVIKQFKPTTRNPKSLQIAHRLFNQEVATLKKLGRHDQIPTFLNFFEENDEFYLVQEFIDGQSLSDEFMRGRLKEAEVVALLQDVLGILEFVHKNQVIHRDIKPGNLIRRRKDGKIVLIDFGAVKEIHTQIAGAGQTSFTVGIGTQGYTPTEQLAGKPRFSSDIYALGMTAIQAITGRQPSQLSEDPDTYEYLWQDYADVSLGLNYVLNRMVRFHYTERYQTASDVLRALKRLSELPTDLTEIPQSLLLPEPPAGPHTQTHPFYRPWFSKIKRSVQLVAIASLATTGVIAGLRQLSWLQPLEIAVYDRMMQWRPALPPDDRLLVVEISEADLKTLQRPTPSDRDVATVMKKLLEYQPRAVGLDLYRDLPQEPGQAELLEQLQSERTIAIMNIGTAETGQIPPPPGVSPKRIGFNDLVIDPDGAVRRNLMFAYIGSDPAFSFSWKLAQLYLKDQGIEARQDPQYPEWVQLQSATFPPLYPSAGGYQSIDDNGYQVLLNYRSAHTLARQVAFTDVLNGRIDPAWVKDKIVLIGTTAPSSKDLFNTPFSAGQSDDPKMAGVIIHAQMVSQILSTALDGRSLLWFWPDWLEMIWIGSWAIAGGCVGWLARHPIQLGAGGIAIIVTLSGASFAIFLMSGWVPVIAPMLAAIMAGGTVIAYRSYIMQQQQQQIITEVWLGEHPAQNPRKK